MAKVRCECCDFDFYAKNLPGYKPGDTRYNCERELYKVRKAFPEVQTKIIADYGPCCDGPYVELTSEDMSQLKRAFCVVACASDDKMIDDAKSWSKEKLDSEAEARCFSNYVEE